MNDSWQQQVIERLVRVEELSEGIVKRLDIQNGSVGRHDKAIIKLRENQKIAFAVAAVLILEHFPQMAETLGKLFIK